MNLAIPLGLLALLGLIVLIVIYILKPKYKRASVSSTFIWKLSLKYAKRKIPFDWLRNSILIILQILILVLIAFMLARPLILRPAAAPPAGEKIVILDAGAAMTAETGGRTRFDRAVAEISALAEEITKTDSISVILAGETSELIVDRSDSAVFVKQALSQAKHFLGEANLTEAMGKAKEVLDKNSSAEIILFTCRNYEDAVGVTVRNIDGGEWNAAILNFNGELSGGYYRFSAEVASYNRDAAIAVELKVDGKYLDSKLAVCSDNQTVIITWDSQVLSYRSAEAALNLDGEDSFPHDNKFFSTRNSELFSVQFVSSTPHGFLSNALTAAGCRVTFPDLLVDRTENPGPYTINDYDVKDSGYDLYVYERMVPSSLPADGAIWLINPDSAPPGSDLTLGIRNQGSFPLTAVSETTGSLSGALLDLVTPENIVVTSYTRVLGYPRYERILSCGGSDPALLVREQNGVKTVVMAFDTRYINPLILDYPTLIRNIIRYSLTETVAKNIYQATETIEINAKPRVASILVNSDRAELEFENFPAKFKADYPGLYTVTQNDAEGKTVAESRFFVRIAVRESNFGMDGGTIKAPVVSSDSAPPKTQDPEPIDIFFFIALAFLVIFFTEWWLQYREQF